MFLTLTSLGLLSLMVAVGAVVVIISSYGKNLPDYNQLKDYQPPVVTRIYAGDGRLVAEYAQEKRVFVPVENIPDLVKDSFIAAEDQHFYQHSGVDYMAIMRAAFMNLKNHGTGKRPVGASTITQQVAKNFLLGNEVSLKRKIREAIVAFRMEQAMSKDRILELYLNGIYLGEGTYGVAAAALNYFNKPLEQLTIEEAAYLAILPKAPNNYNPVRDYARAIERRNWAIGRLAEDGYITAEQAKEAQAKPLTVIDRSESNTVDAPYFAEEVRRELMEHYGANSLYEGGLAVRTSLDPRLQALARETLRDGLEAYDRRHGWRGPLGSLINDVSWNTSGDGWWQALSKFKQPPGAREDWKLATVLNVSADQMTVGLPDHKTGIVPLSDTLWAQTKTSGPLTSLRQVFHAGDVVFVAPGKDKDTKTRDVRNKNGTITPGKVVPGKPNGKWSLRQLPKVSGALVAMDPHTGRVLAIQGGWSYQQSEFDRATQAMRQPGSSFKPFVYLTALENGFTPATRVLDAPFVGSQGPGMPKWAPKNYHNDFLGPTPLRVGIEKSRNLMTVRLANFIGMDKVAATVERFGVMDNMPTYLSYALGAGETTLLRLSTGYAQLVNGGRRITPTFIDRIQDRHGKTIFAHDTRPCPDCGKLVEWNGQDAPVIPDVRQQIADPRNAYQMVSILEGVVKRGTGAAIGHAMPDRPLAGKTGTTNDSKDTWFIGFSPDLVVGVFVGYDHPKSLGHHETGSSVAVPVFKDFMMEALKDEPPTPFRVPPGIHQVLINAHTGTRAYTMDKDTIWEAFLDGTEPSDSNAYILDDAGMKNAPELGPMPEETGADVTDGGYDIPPPPQTPAESAVTGTGGFY
jgi:penicillin-binding protein 1A